LGTRLPGLRRRTLERLAELDVRPSRELGQNFLVDERYLEVVEQAAELSSADVVLEVGGGLGALSIRLAPLVAHLHAVEVDHRLARSLGEDLAPFTNVTLLEADAVRLDFPALEPSPGKLVANLPYGIAATALLKAIEELPDATLFVGMVQREVGERLVAPPGSRAYGVTSVLAQLACEVRVHRRVPRAAFYPTPNVDSAIVVLRRGRPTPSPATRAFVRAAFAHRRKTIAGSLALVAANPSAGKLAVAGAGTRRDAGADDLRRRVRAALAELGHPHDARAERLWPAELERLALAVEGTVEARPR